MFACIQSKKQKFRLVIKNVKSAHNAHISTGMVSAFKRSMRHELDSKKMFMALKLQSYPH